MSISIVSAYDEFGDVDYLLDKAASEIANQRNLGITRDRELHCVAMEDYQVVGAAWVAFDGENYEFDVAVAKGFDRKGIGRMLTQSVISNRSDFCEGYEDTTVLIPVTSMAMCKLLQKEGFVITDVPAKGFFTMGPETECQPFQSPHQKMDFSGWLSP